MILEINDNQTLISKDSNDIFNLQFVDKNVICISLNDMIHIGSIPQVMELFKAYPGVILT